MFELKKFMQPEPAYGIHPFWFWNGDMNDDEIKHQIEEMSEKGVTGFFICARQGLTIPYLSEEWFKKVEFAIHTASEHNMHVWLYDEYPYPSGMAGGEVVLEHADAKHQTLSHHVEKLAGGEKVSLELPWGRTLFVKAVPICSNTEQRIWEEAVDLKDFIGNLQVDPVFQKAGLTAYTEKRFFTYRPKKVLNWTTPDGNWEMHCFLEVEIKDFKYYGTYVDPCHREAMTTFIRKTHEKYAETIGNHFGKVVKGMFTDETHLLGRYPWSPRLVDFVKENYGYDIRDYLYLLVDHDGKDAAKVRYHYFQSIHLLLRETYHKQMHDWCEQHDLEYIAEVPSARMATQLYSHVPGGDSAHEKLGRPLDWILKRYIYGFRKNPKMISSLSNQLGRDRALIESFHSVGWSKTLQDAKWMIDRLAAFGINFFNFHAFFYTLDAMVKHDAPPSQFLQNPYWEHYRLLGDYTARMGYIMSQGAPVRSIAVLDPTTTLWTHMGNPFHNAFAYTGKDQREKMKLEQLKEHWSDICMSLTMNYKDYDYLDPELLERAEITDGVMSIGKTSYTVLILPPLSNLENKAWQKIKMFINQGGTVIANGLLPYEVIDDHEYIFKEMSEVFGLTDNSPTHFWQEKGEEKLSDVCLKGERDAYFIPSTINHSLEERKQALFHILDQHLDEDLLFKVDDDAKSFLLQHRKLTDQSEVVFISNQEGNAHQTTLYMKRDLETTTFSRLNVETGNIEDIRVQQEDGVSKIELHFAPYQSYLIQINEKKTVMKENRLPFEDEWTSLAIDFSGPWEITNVQENMLRFNVFDLRIASCSKRLDEEDHYTGEVQAKTFIDQCEDLAKKRMLPVQFKQTFGTPMKVNLGYPIHVRYQTEFLVGQLPDQCSLVMDQHAISGDLTLYINDHVVPLEDFQRKFVYDHNNIVCDVKTLLVKGVNTIQVKGQVHHDWDGLVDSLYMMGDFGIEFDRALRPVMTELPSHAQSIVGPYKGLPYYAGTVLCRKTIDLEKVPHTNKFLLNFDKVKDFHECAEVIVNGHSLGVKAWSPYEWIGKTDILSAGHNVIEVKVTNTLIGLFEGKYFNYETHEYNDVRIQKTEVKKE